MKLIKRFTDNYRKDDDSNISKLLSIFNFELDRINDAFRTIDDYRHISNATGVTLDNIGKNVLLERDGMDDVTYRLFLRLKIKMNLSGGQIKTINEIMNAILGKYYLGLREVWKNQTYDNEPAAIEIRFVNFFMDIIGKQIVDNENEQEGNEAIFFDGTYYFNAEKKFDGGGVVSIGDPFYFDGTYTFSGERFFNGGYSANEGNVFNFAEYEAKMVELLKKYMSVADFIRTAGVKAWWCEPLDIETLINVQNNVTMIDKENAVNDLTIDNYATMNEQFVVINNASSLFNDMFDFDGKILFDGNRDFAIHDVTTEIKISKKTPVETIVVVENNITLIEKIDLIDNPTALFDGMFYFDDYCKFDGERDFIINDVKILEVSA